MTKTLPLLLDSRLNEIVHFLNDEKIRATYKAVAEVVGGIPQSIGARLGSRRVEASWVVNASSGLPTGYLTHQRHSALLSKTEIITSGSDLERRLVRWRAAGAPKHLWASVPNKERNVDQRPESKPLELLSVDDLADLRRKLTALLNSFDHVRGTQGEGIRKRINRLSHDGGPIPREIAALMTTITEMRNSAEYDSKVLSASECAVVRHAWQAIQEWAQSPRRAKRS